MPSFRLPPLPNIDALIDGEGDITIGTASGISCTATAANRDQCLAMLVRRDSESLIELLMRLEAAIDSAIEDGIYIDEINS